MSIRPGSKGLPDDFPAHVECIVYSDVGDVTGERPEAVQEKLGKLMEKIRSVKCTGRWWGHEGGGRGAVGMPECRNDERMRMRGSSLERPRQRVR